MKSKLPLNHLNTFYYAAEYGSFQVAAEHLFVSASAVSHQIRNLESTLGYKLFNRLDKAISLSSEGEALFADIKLPIEKLHNASRKALQIHNHHSLAISVAPIFATAWLLPRLRDFYQHSPDIHLQVIASFDLVDFDTDPFDAAIRLGKPIATNHVALPLFPANYVVVCHPSYFNNSSNKLSPKQILSASLVQNSAMPKLWSQWFSSADITQRYQQSVALEVPSTAQVIDALQSGDCVGIIDKQFIQKDVDLGRLTIACEHVYGSDNWYTLLAPESITQQAHYLQFAQWLKKQINVL
ncbi:MAG: LysR substrate-binding domain-containing protein [Glaciecola sp.]